MTFVWNTLAPVCHSRIYSWAWFHSRFPRRSSSWLLKIDESGSTATPFNSFCFSFLSLCSNYLPCSLIVETTVPDTIVVCLLDAFLMLSLSVSTSLTDLNPLNYALFPLIGELIRLDGIMGVDELKMLMPPPGITTSFFFFGDPSLVILSLSCFLIKPSVASISSWSCSRPVRPSKADAPRRLASLSVKVTVPSSWIVRMFSLVV